MNSPTPFTDALVAKRNAETYAETVRLLSELASVQSARIDGLEAEVAKLKAPAKDETPKQSNFGLCPFCGQNFIEIDMMRRANRFRVRCKKCMATGPIAIDVKEAIKLWGQRPQAVRNA